MGYSEEACILILSFHEGHKQFVKSKGFRSSVLSIDNRGVLQGRKKTRVLYTLFNLKIVFLSQIIKEKELFSRISGFTLKEYNYVTQEAGNFVDDSMAVNVAEY